MARKATVTQDTDVCGACVFCKVSKSAKDDYECWAFPPMPTMDETDLLALRGLPVEITDTKCWYYQPRKNS
jgi:hypothetical protein